MRLALTIPLLAAAACSDDPGSGGPNVNSHVATYDIPGLRGPSLDLLIVVDPTAAMSPYQTQLGELAASANTALTSAYGALPDLQIAVTTTDAGAAGAFRQPAGTSDAYLVNAYDAHFEVTTNFTGSLADALAPLLAVGTSSSATTQPLEAARLALDAHPGFVRDRSMFGMMTITASDDASPSPTADYASGFKARKTDPSQVIVAGIYDLPATRLDAFHAAFPNRNTTTDIATADFASAFLQFSQYYRTVLGVACLHEPLDLDPDTAGPQYDCDLSAYYDDGTSEPIRACIDGGPARCFAFVPDAQNCIEAGSKRFEARGYPGGFLPTIRGQCVVEGM